jgi:hypothetical protein
VPGAERNVVTARPACRGAARLAGPAEELAAPGALAERKSALAEAQAAQKRSGTKFVPPSAQKQRQRCAAVRSEHPGPKVGQSAWR